MKTQEFKKLNTNDFNKSQEKFLTFLEAEYLDSNKKLLKSKFWFVSLNLFMFVMSTIIVILTMFIVGKKVGGTTIRYIFASISIISSCITFCTGLASLFQFKKRKKMYDKQISKIEILQKEFAQNNDLDESVKKMANNLFEDIDYDI